MQPDAKAEKIYRKIGDYSPQAAVEKGLITEEEREYLVNSLTEKIRPSRSKPEQLMEKDLKLEPKAQDIFDRIKPFSPEVAYDKGLISAEERDYFINLLAERKLARNSKKSLSS
jgi:3-methyladenine DNA glycosylase/8-oxoguanine DNA glycosylase